MEWFLRQEGEVNGFTKAIFSGLPNCVLADVIDKHIIPAFHHTLIVYEIISRLVRHCVL